MESIKSNIDSTTANGVNVTQSANQELNVSTSSTLSDTLCTNTSNLQSAALSSRQLTRQESAQKRDALTQISTNLINSEFKLMSSLNKIELEFDDSTKQTTKSIEMVLNSPMFGKLYDLNKNLNSFMEENRKVKPSESVDFDEQSDYATYDDDDDDESDDSYAAGFRNSMKEIKVYLYEPVDLHTHSTSKFTNNSNLSLFRFLFLRNKVCNKCYVFLIKLNKNIQDYLTSDKDNEFWFYSM